MSNMSRLNMIPKLYLHEFEKCACCNQAKITKASYKSIITVIESIELIHFDLCEFDGMLNSRRYFITFIDDCSEFTFIYFLKNKSDAFDMFKAFVIEVENLFNKRIKRLYSDRGTRYDLVALMSFITQRNSIKKKNCTLFS